MGVIRSYRACGLDLQRLITGVQFGNRQMSFQLRFVLQRALHRRVKLGLAMEAFRDAGHISRQNHIEWNYGRVDGRFGVVIPSQIYLTPGAD